MSNSTRFILAHSLTLKTLKQNPLKKNCFFNLFFLLSLCSLYRSLDWLAGLKASFSVVFNLTMPLNVSF